MAQSKPVKFWIVVWWNGGNTATRVSLCSTSDVAVPHPLNDMQAVVSDSLHVNLLEKLFLAVHTVKEQCLVPKIIRVDVTD